MLSVLAGTLGLGPAGAAPAETVSLTCTELGAGTKIALSYVFDGEEKGTLTLDGAFGKMTLPGTRTVIQNPNQNATLISAGGEATVPMPDRGALDACVAGKIGGGADPDMRAIDIMNCGMTTPSGATPVPARVSFSSTAARLDPKDADSIYREAKLVREYADPSRPPLEIETVLLCE